MTLCSNVIKNIILYLVPGSITSANRSSSKSSKNLMLFNLKIDPIETIDMSDRFPDVALIMLKRLEYYQKGMVDYDYPENDLLSDPSLRNGYWQPWR